MRKSLKLIGNFVFIIALLAVLFSYAMFQGGFVSWFLFTSFLPILLYQLGFLLYPIHNWRITRELSHRVVRAGESITVSINLKRNIPFPIYFCTLEEEFSETLNQNDIGFQKYQYLDRPDKLIVPRHIKKAVFPGFKRTIQLDYEISHIPRGKHHFKAIRVRTGDIFGFVQKEVLFPVENHIVANPTQLSLRMNGKISNFEQGAISTSTNSLSNTNIAVGVREYEPGDRFSWIDWKQTARKNTVMTKEFEQEKSSNILLILDSCCYPALNPLAFEASVEMTLSLLEMIQKKGTEVGLLSIGGQKGRTYFPMHQDKMSKGLIVDYLARIEPEGTRPFAVQLREQMMQMDSGDMVFLIITHIDDVLKQTIKQINKRLKRIHIVFIQATAFISEKDRLILGQLQMEGIGVQIITEENLLKKPIEVSVR